MLTAVNTCASVPRASHRQSHPWRSRAGCPPLTDSPTPLTPTSPAGRAGCPGRDAMYVVLVSRRGCASRASDVARAPPFGAGRASLRAHRQIWRRWTSANDGRVRRRVPSARQCDTRPSRWGATSRQSTLCLPVVSRYIPSHPENTPLAEVDGAKKRIGSARTLSSCMPSGSGHHNEMTPSGCDLRWRSLPKEGRSLGRPRRRGVR